MTQRLTAFFLVLQSAIASHPQATNLFQAELNEIYPQPYELPCDFMDVLQAMETDYTEKNFQQGLQLEESIKQIGGSIPDYLWNDCIDCYTLAAGRGHFTAQLRLGKLFLKMHLPHKATPYLRSVANQGNIEASYHMGIIMFDHFQDLEQAKAYFQAPAQAGIAYAEYALGMTLLKMRQPEEIYFPWIEKAYKQGLEKATREIAFIYANKNTKKYDVNDAIRLFEDLYKKNPQDQMVRTIMSIAFLERNQNRSDIERAYIFLNELFKENFTPAYYHYGMHYISKGEIKDGISQLRKAAQNLKAYPPACYELSLIYGTVGSHYFDPNKSLTYLKKAAELKYSPAIDLLRKHQSQPK
jgi:TPR repeat protein